MEISKKFTIHNASIKTKRAKTHWLLFMKFTIHNASIKTLNYIEKNAAPPKFTIHNASIKTIDDLISGRAFEHIYNT